MVILILICIIALVVWGISINNSLIRKSTNVDEAWSQIDVQLKRRNDLIPNLINTVKGSSKYEQTTLEKITQMRQQLIKLDNGNDQKAIMDKSNELSQTLKSLFAVSENYPDLKASQQYQTLMEELSTTENKIAYARQLYNSTTADFNQSIKTFPNSLIANMKHFTSKDYLETPENEKQVPKVEF